MKEKILAVILLLGVIAFVSVNTIVLNRQIANTIDSVNDLDLNAKNASEKAKIIYEDFRKKEKYMSLTVSHNDLTCIEDCFVEMIGYLSIKDTENATVTKSRLISYLEHLGRLSGFNIDAVI